MHKLHVNENGTFDKISLSTFPDALRLPCHINPSHFTVLTNHSLCSWSACCMTHAQQVGDKMEERRFSWWHAMRWQISQLHKKSRQRNPLWYLWQGLNMKIVLENLQQPFCVKSIRWERIFLVMEFLIENGFAEKPWAALGCSSGKWHCLQHCMGNNGQTRQTQLIKKLRSTALVHWLVLCWGNGFYNAS